MPNVEKFNQTACEKFRARLISMKKYEVMKMSRNERPPDIDDKPRIGRYVKMISNMIHRNLVLESEEEKLTATYGWILGFLEHHADEEICQRDLEEKFCLRRATISKTLMAMEQKGLVDRVSVPHDARLKRIVITEKGVRLNRQIIDQLEDIELRMAEGVPPEKLEIFFEVAEQIKHNLSKGEEKDI